MMSVPLLQQSRTLSQQKLLVAIALHEGIRCMGHASLSGWSAPEGCLLEEGSRVTLEAAGTSKSAHWRGYGKMCNAELS